jgi:Mobilization protein NikA
MERDMFVTVRVSGEEKRQLEARAALFGQSASEYLRRLIAAAGRREAEPPALRDDSGRIELVG